MRDAKLKAAIFEDGRTLIQLAADAKLPPMYISLACSGRYNLDEEQKAKLARALKKPQGELFQD